VTGTEQAQRRQLVVSGLAERQLGGLLVSSPANIRYLTGFTGSNGLALLLPEQAVLFTDPRYGLQAAGEVDCQVRVERGALFLAVTKWLQRKRIRRLGCEAAHLTHEAFLALDDHAPARLTLVPTSDLVETLRMVKSPQEIDLIRRAVLLNSEALAQTIPLIRPGVSEIDLAAEIEYRMRKLGAEKPAFETIVASGPRSALPHASPMSKTLTVNELLLIDMGAVRDGYCSDMTRMAFLGRPSPKARRLYRAVLEAQLAAIAAVRAGITAGAIDRVARRVLKGHGLAEAFVHSTGHGLGLEIHERPRLGKQDRTRLQAGMAITIEPGVYLQEFGGVRIEDTVVVTRNGCEILTPTSKELLVL
jgi:Xaa-Pro aminopeptidase